MKKEIKSLVAVLAAMTMTTTSVFAFTERGTGEMDKDNVLTANDVEMVLNLVGTYDDDANVDGKLVSNGGRLDSKSVNIDDGDAHVLLHEILQPKYVVEGLNLRGSTSIGRYEDKSFAPKVLSLKLEQEREANGLLSVKGLEGTENFAEIEKQLTEPAENNAQTIANNLTTGLNRIKFYSISFSKDVDFKSDEGWAQFIWAFESIIPMRKSDLILLDPYSLGNNATNPYETASPEQQKKADALQNIKNLIGAGTGNDLEVKVADLEEIKKQLEIAFPGDAYTDAELADIIDRINTINNGKYEITIETEKPEGNGPIDITDPKFIDAVKPFIEYRKQTIGAYLDKFGDFVELHVKNTETGNEWSFNIELFEFAEVDKQ